MVHPNENDTEIKEWFNKLNPFNRNYVFSEKDTERAKATFRDKLRFLFCPTFVQAAGGYAWFHKVNNQGEILLVKYEKLDIDKICEENL